MNATTIIVRGTIRADGTLELAEPLGLTPCEVEVTVRPVGPEAFHDPFHVADTDTTIPSNPSREQTETLLDLMLRTRAELEASGAVFRTKEEIDADLEADRDWDSELDEIRRQAEESQRQVESR